MLPKSLNLFKVLVAATENSRYKKLKRKKIVRTKFEIFFSISAELYAEFVRVVRNPKPFFYRSLNSITGSIYYTYLKWNLVNQHSKVTMKCVLLVCALTTDPLNFHTGYLLHMRYTGEEGFFLLKIANGIYVLVRYGIHIYVLDMHI
jgi:hypothetical protein